MQLQLWATRMHYRRAPPGPGGRTTCNAPRWKEPLDPGPKQVRHTAHCKGPPGTRRSHHTTILKGSPGRQGTLQGATWAKIVSPHGCMSKAAKVHYEGPLVPLDGPLGPRRARHHAVVTQGAPGARRDNTVHYRSSPGAQAGTHSGNAIRSNNSPCRTTVFKGPLRCTMKTPEAQVGAPHSCS